MNTPRFIHVVLTLLAFLLVVPCRLRAEELEMINRPVNTSGLTGLLQTTAPYTLPPGSLEAGFSVLSERSYDPDYSVTAYPVTMSYGLNETMEIALKSAYWSEEESNITKMRGVGDSELAFKWNMLPPREYSSRPSVALLAAGIGPTGDRSAGTNSIQHWGFRTGMAVGSEILIEDYVMGVYADGQITVQDLSDPDLRDWYHQVNAGILLPISKYRNLQMFFEYNRQKGKEVVTLHEDDHSTMTYGLRLVSTRFNLTIGTQFVHKFEEGLPNASRIIGLLSIKLVK